MIPAARFAPLGTQEQEILQPECPVYVHCTRRSVERESGTPFLQVRMVNRADRPVGTVYLRIEGLDASGQVRYTLRELALTGLHAAPRAVFGEERMLVLPAQEAASVRVLVERVVFEGGTLWRRLPEHRLTTLAESGWRRCACSMPNPPESARCLLCGRPLAPPQRELPPEAPQEVFPVWEPEPAPMRPAPIVRDFTPTYPEELYEAAEERSAPRVLVVLLCIFGGAAVLAAAAFLTFCLLKYLK